MDLGSVPDWIGSVLTGGSVFIAALAYRRSVLDRERRQASQIGAWLAFSDESGNGHPVARVNNSSDAPVYEVTVRFAGLADLTVPELIAGSIVTLELPDSARKFIHTESRSGSVGLKLLLFEVESSRVEEKIVLEEGSAEIQFRDAVGRWWKRDDTGRLSRINGSKRIVISTREYTSSRTRIWPGPEKSSHSEKNY